MIDDRTTVNHLILTNRFIKIGYRNRRSDIITFYIDGDREREREREGGSVGLFVKDHTLSARDQTFRMTKEVTVAYLPPKKG
jgi:hypothetical protein